MILSALITAFIAPAQAAVGDSAVFAVPSGRAVHLLEYIDETGTGAGIFRARFMAPDMAEGVDDLDAVFSDMEHLCNIAALPEAVTRGLQPEHIIVSLSATPLDLGEIAPDVAQFFESYSVQDDTCIWELF